MKTVGPLYSGKLNVQWDEKGMGTQLMEKIMRHCVKETHRKQIGLS